MTDTADWQKLARALRELHRALLEHARRDYERDHFLTLGAGELLQLLTTNADFEWIRSLSELMVDLDLIHDAAPLHSDELTTTVRAAVEHVLSAPKTPDLASPFARHYWAYVHDDPHVAMAHAGVKQAIAAWPRPPQNDTASLLHERHRLAEQVHHLARRTKTETGPAT